MGLAFRRMERSSAASSWPSARLSSSTPSPTWSTGSSLPTARTTPQRLWLDGIWLLGYAALAVAGYLAMGAPRPATAPRAQPLVRLTLAYGPGLVLFAVVVASESPGRRYLTVAWLALGALTVTRQWVATRETREVVEEGRDAILASVSHDLRTPLSAVQGYSQLLAGEWDRHSPSERQEMLETIQDQAVHLSRLVTDIIDVSRGRAATIVLSRRPCPADAAAPRRRSRLCRRPRRHR